MSVLYRAIDGHVGSPIASRDPAKRRARTRDEVRLMVAHRDRGLIAHHRFVDLPRFLRPGDALVVNTSATIPAAVAAITRDGRRLRIHLSSPISGDLWWLEVRTPTGGGGTAPGPDLEPQPLALPGGASAHLISPDNTTPRLWIGRLVGVGDLDAYLAVHGSPIRYLPGDHLPMREYQTVFASELGSAEMPSAARPFTSELVTRLVTAGVVLLPVLLHTGVSSYEGDETPGVERYRVPATTAALANLLRRRGGQVVAVGTTVVRALETVAGRDGKIHPGEGQTDLVIAGEDVVRSVDGLITGWHEPNSSHIRMLEAVMGPRLIGSAYQAAVEANYVWHEFGDSLLILP